MYSAVHDLLVDGRETRIYSNGSGPPVLCLHDLGASAAAFEPLTGPVVAGGRELVAIDLPGCGHSDPIPGSELAGYVDALVSLLPRLSDKPIDLLGHGFGGYLAIGVAAAAPSAVARLVVREPALPPRSGPPARTRMSPSMAVSGAVTTLRRGRLRQNLHGFSRAKAVLEQLAQADPGWWESLSGITAPTLVLGEGAHLDDLLSAIPGAVRATASARRSPADLARPLMDFLGR